MPYVALVAAVAARAQISRAAVWVCILANTAGTFGSVALLLGVLASTALGYAFVVAQALAVAVLAELQYVGLRSHAPMQAA